MEVYFLPMQRFAFLHLAGDLHPLHVLNGVFLAFAFVAYAITIFPYSPNRPQTSCL